MTSLINSELNDAGQGDVPEACLVSSEKPVTVYDFFKIYHGIHIYLHTCIILYAIY